MLVLSDKKGFHRNPLSWIRAVQSIENKDLHFYDTRPPKLGRKEDRDTLGIALTELGFTAEMSHWIIFWIMVSLYGGSNRRSFAKLRKEYSLTTCLRVTHFSPLADYLIDRRMA